MHKIKDHIVKEDDPNIQLKITADDNHNYTIEFPNGKCLQVSFQDGVIKSPDDVNGLTMEALIAICIDRLEAFQATRFKCEKNDEALDHLSEALAALHSRTRDRIERGVYHTEEI